MSTTPAAAGTAAFKRINRAMLVGGFSAFALLYCVQPLLPVFAAEFALTPAQSSWALSISTLALALALIGSGALAQRLGRKRLMTVALGASAACTLLAALAPGFPALLAARAVLGIALGGMPAVAMAYLSEEIEGSSLGLSMGMYIAGSALGGMAGRVVTSLISDLWSWRLALGAMGIMGMYAAWEFGRCLPASTRARPAAGGWTAMLEGARAHLTDGGLPWLYALAFVLMGVFVSMYNYIGYRLLAAPIHLGQSIVGALSVLYLLGIFSAVWAGRLADRAGRRNVLWLVMLLMFGGLLLTMASQLALVVLGMAMFTFGFFASHSVASSWVGRRAQGQQALASALYLFFYYAGSGVVGSGCGLLWQQGGWGGVVAFLSALLAIALAIAIKLRTLAPHPALAPPGKNLVLSP